MMLRNFLALASLAFAAAACTAETLPPGTDSTTGGTQPGTSSGSTPEQGATPDGVYSVSCSGEIAKPSGTGVEIAPKCVGGPPGTNCGGPAPASCGPQDVKFHYAPPMMRCMGTNVYEWNGTACVVHNTQGEGGMLKCTGKDCENLFKTKEACDAQLRACLAN